MWVFNVHFWLDKQFVLFSVIQLFHYRFSKRKKYNYLCSYWTLRNLSGLKFNVVAKSKKVYGFIFVIAIDLSCIFFNSSLYQWKLHMDLECSGRPNIFLSTVTQEDWLSTKIWFVLTLFCSLLRKLLGYFPHNLRKKVDRTIMLIPTKDRQGWLWTIAHGSQDVEEKEMAFGE